MSSARHRFIVNDEPVELAAPATLPLLWALRDHLDLRGTKYGCGVGVCGICTVHVDGAPTRACVTPLGDIAGRRVTTIEGLAREPSHPVIEAWIAEQVPQCGYCQPGQIMAAAAALERLPSPTLDTLEAELDAVVCRCGTQPRIRRALRRVLAQREDGR